MGDGKEGGDKDRSNFVVAGCAVQGSSSVGVIIWEQDLGGNRVHAKSTIYVPSSVSKKYYRDDGTTYNDWRAAVSPGG